MSVDPQFQAQANKNWYEVRTAGRTPERRAYHATFVINQYFYVFGGEDIENGTHASMWYINTEFLHQARINAAEAKEGIFNWGDYFSKDKRKVEISLNPHLAGRWA